MFKQSITILLIEDNPGDARLIREMLMEAQSVTFHLKLVDQLTKGLECLAHERFDVLLLDLSLPDSHGLETLITVHRHQPLVPTVVLTGYDDESTGIQAVHDGAQDYLVKGRVDHNLLIRSLRYAIERKRAESELEWERAKWRAILDGMGEGLIYYEESSHHHYINDALVRMTGYTAHEFAQESEGYLDLLRSASVSAADMRHLYQQIDDGLQRDRLWRGEMRLRRQDDSEFDASLTCSPITAINGQIAGIVFVIRDISQEKVLEAQKARFVANASHELRTPLTNLQTTVYLMRHQPGNLREHLEKLDYIADRMQGLVEDLLDVSRFERGIIPLDRQLIVLQDLMSCGCSARRRLVKRSSSAPGCRQCRSPFSPTGGVSHRSLPIWLLTRSTIPLNMAPLISDCRSPSADKP